MATLMAGADLFVGAGGSSAWERCCLGLPGLVLSTADNQVDQSSMLARAGAQIYLGPAHVVDARRLANAIVALIELPDLLIHMAQQGRGLVDGQGARRVADQLLAAVVSLRRAQPGDCDTIHAWRNHPDTRRSAFDGEEFDQDTHARWFACVLADPDCELLVAEREGQSLGVLRYDIESGLALVSIYLVPGLAGQGWGVRLLLAGEDWLRGERQDVRQCEAEVRSDNPVSSRAFLAAGYQPDRSIYKKDLHG
jgi:RimJ/RimL family protein N-acetyltransferase